MSFLKPSQSRIGELVTAADLNTGLRDNLLAFDENTAGAWTLLGEEVADGTSTDMIVAGIPDSHKDMCIIIHGRHAGTVLNVAILKLNTFATGYRYLNLYSVDNGSPSRQVNQSATEVLLGYAGDEDFGAMLWIPNYGVGIDSTVFGMSYGMAGSGAGEARLSVIGGIYTNQIAVSQVEAVVFTDNWLSGSRLSIYGVGDA